jgi:hypothetical protein
MGRRGKKLSPRPPTVPPTKKTPTAVSAVERPLDVTAPPPEETLALIGHLQELRNSQILTLVTRPDVTMRGDIIGRIHKQLREIGRVPQIDLFLHSSGGQTEIPWRIITLIRDFCDHFTVLIPAIAHSAATHLAMGADEIVMGPFSELSPVDPARSHPLLPRPKEEGPPLLVSVQDLRHCMEFIKREVGDSSPESLAAILAALFDKIHPLAVGAIQQSYDLSRLISTKALSTHMDSEVEKEKIEQIVDAFSDKFFSHDYRIGWKEAKEVGLKVTRADDELWETMWTLCKHYRAYFGLARDIGNGKVASPIVWIDTIHQRCILEEILILREKEEKAEVIGIHWGLFPWSEVNQPNLGEDE